MKEPVMPLNQALAYAQVAHLPLHYDERLGVDLWTPHKKVPISLRRSVVKHRRLLLDMMRQGDVRVCPARDLHRQYWRYIGDSGYVCEACQQLEPAMRSA